MRMLCARALPFLLGFLFLVNAGCGSPPDPTPTPGPSPAGESPTPNWTPTPTTTPTATPIGSPTPTATPIGSPTPTSTPMPTPTLPPDEDADGYSPFEGDCNDTDASIHPFADELPYDGIDQDCRDGDLVDVDADGSAALQAGGDDCNDGDSTSYPGATEHPYDGIDQDCSGADTIDVDEDGYAASEVQGDDCDDRDSDSYPGASEVPYDGVDQSCDGADLIDVDGDGYDGTAAGGDDCDDSSPYTYPGASELGDGADNDCDGLVDEGVSTVDNDGDGFSEVEADCNDEDPSIYPGSTEVPYDGIDQDCSGTDLTDVDEDGATASQVGGPDCEDADPNIGPQISEVCDGIDNDCDGAIDESVLITSYRDADGDGYGDPSRSTIGCSVPAGYVTDNTDCKDSNDDIYPGASELCNGLDDDCDLSIDEGVQTAWYADTDGDGYGDAGQTVNACSKPTGYVSNANDCDDSSAGIYPGAKETCNTKDDDCDAQIDEGVQSTYYQDSDGDGYGNPAVSIKGCSTPDGYVSDNTDCVDGDDAVHPGATELCNGIDDNCNKSIDEGVKLTFYLDNDGDGYGITSSTAQACSVPEGYSEAGGDCNDSSAAIHPGAAEVCNGLDDNCNSQADEGVKTTYYLDADGDGYGGTSTYAACAAPPGYSSEGGDCNDSKASVNPAASEVPNAIDDNCDGQVDEGVLFPSCKYILAAYPSSSSGVYTIDPDGVGGAVPFEVYCDMSTAGGGWTLVWKHSYMESGSVSFINSNAASMRYYDNTTSEPCTALHNGVNVNDKKWCNVPGKTVIGTTEMRLMASYNGTPQYDYRGPISGGGYNLDTHWRGAYFGAVYTKLVDTCTYANGYPPEPVGPDNTYEITGITFDKYSYGNPNGNCDTDRYAYGSAEDCRWENCQPSGLGYHVQMTFHILVR